VQESEWADANPILNGHDTFAIILFSTFHNAYHFKAALLKRAPSSKTIARKKLLL